MKQRNKVFAGVSLAVAAVAVGGGAMVSASAMGSTPEGQPPNVLTMISMSSDSGEAVQCTFEGADAEKIVAASTMGAPTLVTGGTPAAGDGPVLVKGSATATGDGPTFTVGGVGVSADGTVPAPPEGAQVITGSISVGDVPPGQGTPIVVNSGDVRDGTPEECAAMAAGPETP